MSDVRAAEKRLEQAVARLETALESRARISTAEAPVPAANPTFETETAETETAATVRDVTMRLDTAIHRLRRALEE